MKKDHRLMHPKLRPYLDWFICGSVSNSLQCSIAERDHIVIVRLLRARLAKNLQEGLRRKERWLLFEKCEQRLQTELKLRWVRQGRHWIELKRWS